MPKFCIRCRAQLDDTANFCPHCGAAQPVAPGKDVREGIPAPGFSDRVRHPEILKAMKKNRAAAGVFGAILVPLPLIGFLIYSFFSDKMETVDALKYGAIVSGVFLLFAIIGSVVRKAKKTYDAVVIDKKTESTYRRGNSDTPEHRTLYITVVRTSAGKKKKIVESEGSLIQAYTYLNVGDRFRCHPQFHFPYELYDKSKAPYIACVSCSAKNPTTADRCQKCGVPLLK